MIETIINLRDRDVWPKRKLLFDDAERQTRAALASLEAKGFLKAASAAGSREPGQRRGDGRSSSRVDATLRDLALLRLNEFRPDLGRPTRRRGGRLPPRSRRPAAGPSRARPRPSGRTCSTALASTLRRPARPRAQVRRRDGPGQGRLAPARRPGRAPRRPRPPRPDPEPLEQAADAAGDLLGIEKRDPLHADHRRGSSRRTRPPLKERVRTLNWELFDRAVGVATWAALEELTKLGADRKLRGSGRDPGGAASPPRLAGEAVRRPRLPLEEDEEGPRSRRWTPRSRSPAGGTSGRSRSSTGSTCSPPACGRRSASRSSATTSTKIQDVSQEIAAASCGRSAGR